MYVNELGGVPTMGPIPTVAGVNPVKSETKDIVQPVEKSSTNKPISGEEHLGNNIDLTV